MKLLLDEMLSPRIAEHLRDRGFDVIAVAESPALRRQPDEAIFAVAQTQDRAIATKNIADFRRLASSVLHAGEHHPGLILISNRRFPDHDPNSVGRLITALSTVLDSEVDLADAEFWLT